jgi:hypothetical protein
LSAFSKHVEGDIVSVGGDKVVAQFPVPVRTGAMLTLLSGRGDAVSGLAIVDKCEGNMPPYTITSRLYVTTDAEAIAAGKKGYVLSENAGVAPSQSGVLTAVPASRGPASPDLKLYYYAAAQNVGYGALGIGYERTVRLSRGLCLEVDGGITGIGNVDSASGSAIDTNESISTLNGALRFDFTRNLGVYSAYRWTKGSGDDDRWKSVTGDLNGKEFVAVSDYDAGTVNGKGIEYGFTVRPLSWFGFSAGYIPEYRMDYGSFGVRSEPAYTAELRFGKSRGAARIRGIYSDGYWQGDLGVTIR